MARTIRFGLLGLAIAFAAGPSTSAQDTGGLEIASVTGKFAAMQENRIKVVTADKEDYFVVMNNQTRLQYKGTADPKFLMPGLMVRFSASLLPNGMTESPVAEIEVFTLSLERRMSPEQQREQTPGVYQEVGDVGAGPKKPEPKKIDTNKPDLKKPDSKRTEPKNGDKNLAKPTAAAHNYRVVGQILGSQGNKLFVQAGQARVQFELDPQAAISVSASDSMFCQLDDEVKVSGLRTAGQDKYIQAETIQITGSKPLGPAEGKAAKNVKSSRTSKLKGKDADDPRGEAAKPAVGVKAEAQKPSPKK